MRRVFPIVLIAIALQSCSEYQKVLKHDDVKAKYDMAETFYEEGDFRRANRLLEQIAPKYVGKPQGERVMFFLSNSYFQRGDYNMAGYQFERFVKSYPKSDKAVEATFLGAKALLKLQNFINTYAESEYFAEANAMAQELTTKKEQKAFEILKQYNKLGEFNYDMLKSAVAASDNFVADNPGSPFREEAMFVKVEALTHMAVNSFEQLKEERLKNAKAAHAALMKQFPESKFDKEATDLIEKIDKELQRMQQAQVVGSK